MREADKQRSTHAVIFFSVMLLYICRQQHVSWAVNVIYSMLFVTHFTCSQRVQCRRSRTYNTNHEHYNANDVRDDRNRYVINHKVSNAFGLKPVKSVPGGVRSVAYDSGRSEAPVIVVTVVVADAREMSSPHVVDEISIIARRTQPAIRAWRANTFPPCFRTTANNNNARLEDAVSCLEGDSIRPAAIPRLMWRRRRVLVGCEARSTWREE